MCVSILFPAMQVLTSASLRLPLNWLTVSSDVWKALIIESDHEKLNLLRTTHYTVGNMYIAHGVVTEKLNNMYSVHRQREKD